MNDQPTIELPKSPSEIVETLADGKVIQVTFDDNRAPEMIKVRRVPRNQFLQFVEAIARSTADPTNEADVAAFYCLKERAWAESLSDESFAEVMEEGQRLNFSRFAAWLERRTSLMNLIKAGPVQPETTQKRSPHSTRA